MFEKGLGHVDGLRVGVRASVRALGYISHSLSSERDFRKTRLDARLPNRCASGAVINKAGYT